MAQPFTGLEKRPSTLNEVLRWRSSLHPGRHLCTFLPDSDGATGGIDWTYGDLDRRSRAIGARLQQAGLSGARALLLFPPGLDFIAAYFGCLYAGVVAVPAYLPRPHRPMSRLLAIVNDAQPSAVLTASGQASDLVRWATEVPKIGQIPNLTVDTVPDPLAEEWSDPGVGPDTLAFLQYTSGSTAAPKGVMVAHRQLVANSTAIHQRFASDEQTRGVSWLPLYHDMGLIGGVIQPIFCGGSITLLSPTSFLQRPFRWLDTISRFGGTICGGPNFAYDLCVRKVTDQQKAGLDLSRWSVAFNGAEPLRAETIERFASAFASCGFRREAFLPCYGLAEATLLVSGAPASDPPILRSISRAGLSQGRVVAADPDSHDAQTLVGSGKVVEGHDIAIVDPEKTTHLPPGQVGEVWVRGPSVAQGYWGRAEESDPTFGAVVAETDDGPFLRTGDLGFLDSGELFVTGRRKDLIIVRGRNVYPQDVESTVEQAHPSLRRDASAAFAIEVGGEERLVVVQEVERNVRGWDSTEALNAIRRAVAEAHELDLHAICLIRPLSIPRTSSGKIQRHLCRDAYETDALAIVAKMVQAEQAAFRREIIADARPVPSLDESRSAETIGDWLAFRIAGPLGVRPELVDLRASFASFGLGSLQAVSLAGELEEWLGRPLSATLLYEYPTIEALAGYLAGRTTDDKGLTLARGSDEDAIAIIGIGCRFPGASGPGAFWRLVRDGVDAIGAIPADRWDANAYYDADPKVPGKLNTRRGGFLDQVDRFDAAFFGLSPREAVRTDPQQRLLMEVAWEAFEDAGQPVDRLAGARVGVFVGIATNDYGRLQWAAADASDPYLLAGNASSIAANRLSYLFDFRGPSLAVDTACSSSLVAVHLACQALRQGEATLALAGGVNVILSPEIAANFTKAGFLAPDGLCKTFDASADGYGRGEGAGLVVLKPLKRALADGDPIYAVIRGGAVNQDGRTNGLTSPSPRAQEAVLREAYLRAGIAPGDLAYIEAHGTGTLLGDPIEAHALGAVLAEGRAPGRPCLIGSVKTNIGHLEAAAGVAGLIKVALSVHNRAIPPSLHFHKPNPHIAFERLPLKVSTTLEAWPAAAPPLAGVSSFGFGGTNVHIVLEGVEQPEAIRAQVEAEAEDDTAWLVPLSARDTEALAGLARTVAAGLSDTTIAESLRDVAYSTGVRRSHHDHRLAVVARSRAEVIRALGAFASGAPYPGLSSGRAVAGRRPRIAFVFSGQGGRWSGMGRDLLDSEPAFRAAVEECDAAFRPLTGWSVLEALRGNWPEEHLARTDVAQPTLFAIQVGLAALWRSWGVVANRVVGHSLGEAAAAHAAGVLSLDDAVRVVFHRGRLMQRLAGRGKTAAVGLSADQLRGRLAGVSDRIWVAAINAPGSVVLSGEPTALDDLVASLQEDGLPARFLGVDCAFHSPQMDSLRPEFTAALEGLESRPGSIPMASTVTGRIEDGRSFDADYWGRNLRETVRFSDAIETLADGTEIFIEIGPHPVLSRAVADGLDAKGRKAAVLPSIHRERDGRGVMLGSLGAIYATGGSVDWRGLTPSGRFVRFPAYPWQRERFWFSDDEAEGRRLVAPVTLNGHPKAHSVNGDGERAIAKVDDLLYRLHWTPVDRPEQIAPREAGRWVILADRLGVAQALRSILEARGETCLLTAAGDDLAEVCRSTGGERPCRGVVDLRALDARSTARTTAEALERAIVAGSGDVLNLARAISGLHSSDRPRLWVVTSGAQAIRPGVDTPALAQAHLWGLGRSLAQEYPEVWGGLVDLDADDPAGGLEKLADELIRPTEDAVAFRRGLRHVARLRRLETVGATEALHLRPEGTYLISGGLGGVGLRAARWLVERGARRLILLGRRGLPDRSRWDELGGDDPSRAAVEAIRALEHSGATVVTASGDVADAGRMAELAEGWRGLLPPVRGILHAAGVVTPRSASAITSDDLSAVLRPKVAGTSTLLDIARAWPLDFFVAFSSISSVWGSRDLAHYAAANGFLDACAHHDRPFPFLSVNWGPFEAVGMAATDDRARRLRLLGLRPIRPDRGFQALERLIATGVTQATVADVDWATFKALQTGDGQGRRHLLDEVEERNGSFAPAGRDEENHRFEGNGLPVDRSREGLVRFFRERAATVLRIEPERLEVDRPLNTVGLDSLMAMELKGRIDADLKVSLPLKILLEGPSVDQLAESALRLLEASSHIPTATPSVAGNEGEVVEAPLSIGQQSLWYLHQIASDDASYNIAGAARIREPLDVAALRRSFQRLVDRHASLRTTFATLDGRPVQRVRDREEVWFSVADSSELDEVEIARRLAEEARRPFDLERGPLFRASLFSRSADDHCILLSVHHTVSDFWSIALLMDELGSIYPAEASGRALELPPLAIEAADFARAQVEMLAGPEGERLRTYWDGELAGDLPVLNLPTDRPRPAVQRHRGATRSSRLGPKLTRDLIALGEAQSASLYATLLAAFQTLLARYGGQDRVIVGTPVAGRGHRGISGVVGYFVNPLPIRADLSGNPTFEEWLRQVRLVVHQGLEHQDYPFALMVDRAHQARDPSRSPIFQVMFAYQKAQRLDDRGLTPFVLHEAGARMHLGGLVLESVELDLGTAQFDLTLTAAESDGDLAVSIEYDIDLFNAATIDRILGHYRVLLGAVVAQPNLSVASLPILDEHERRLVLHDWNGSDVATPRSVCVHTLFEEQVVRAPGATAVAFQDRTLTYRELNERANQLAHYLRQRGVGPESLVGLCIDRSPEMAVGLLGILKAGGAYLPLAPEGPASRLAAQLEECEAVAIVTREALRGMLPATGPDIICLDTDAMEIGRESAENPSVPCLPDNLAYAIYTSGSTGRPKGVLVTHRSVVAHVAAIARLYDLREQDRALQFASISFDVAAEELFPTWASGAAVVLRPDSVATSLDDFNRLIDEERITIANLPTQYWQEWTRDLAIRGGTLPPSLRLVVVGGDKAQPDRLAAWLAVAGGRVRWINAYGPTEATITSTVYEAQQGGVEDPVPIGRPIPGARAYVLDRRLQPVPIGVPGELFLGGHCLARGYRSHPGPTAERFLPDPFSVTPGARMYRTGDLVRWRADGELEFLGRLDDQVKVRGFRIEPGEVEAALASHPKVHEAVVVAREDVPGDKQLVGYVVAPGCDPVELRGFLKARLPEHMVPSAIVLLPALPMTAGGKVDRRALPAPEPARDEGLTQDTAPRSPAEEGLARVVAGVLGLDRVGIHDNLFDLGLDSIKSIQIVSRSRQAGWVLHPTQLFRHQSVAELAATVAPLARSDEMALELISAARSTDSVHYSATDFPLAGLDQASLDRAFAGQRGIEDVYPTSPMQEGMLFYSMYAPESGMYVMQFACTLRGDLDLPVFAESWKKVLARHPALRTAFQWVDADRPMQVVLREAEMPVKVEDWRDADPVEQKDRLEAFLLADRVEGFVLSWAPLMRLTLIRLEDDAYRFVWTNHHLLFDGWCLPVLLNEALTFYEAGRDSREANLPEPRHFRDYIVWLQGQSLDQAKPYWTGRLQGIRSPTPLGIDRDGFDGLAGDAIGSFMERDLQMSTHLTTDLQSMGRSHHLTLNTLIQGAWALLLGRYSGHSDVVFGATVSGRPATLAGVEEMIGLFINTLPVRVEIREEMGLVAWLKGIQDRMVELREYEFTPLDRVQAWSEIPRRLPLFESIVICENYPMGDALRHPSARLGVEAIHSHERTNFPLALMAFPGTELRLRVGFDADRFDPAAIERLLKHLRTVLTGFVAGTSQRLADVALMADEEREQILRSWNDPESGFRPAISPELERLSEEELESMIHRLYAERGHDQ